MNYDTVIRTTRVKEEDETLSEIAFIIIIIFYYYHYFERVFIRLGNGKVVQKNHEVNGEFGSVNAEGGNRSRGFRRSTWLGEVYRQK